MRALVLMIELVLTATTVASAQTTPVRSFEDLPKVLKLGQTVIVHGTDGHKRDGRVIVLTGDQLQLRLSGLVVVGSSTQSFAAATVQRIDLRDSPVQGSLVGLGIGAGLAVVGCHTSEPGECGTGVEPLIAVPAAIMGLAIDHFVTRRVYETPRPPGVTIGPSFGRSHAAVVARIWF